MVGEERGWTPVDVRPALSSVSLALSGPGLFVAQGLGTGIGGWGRGAVRLVVLAFGLFFVAWGVLTIRRGSRYRQRSPDVQIETTRIADLSVGEAAIAGTASPTEAGAVEAPLTGTPVLAARAEARDSRVSSSGGSGRPPIARTQVATPFVVDDGTGTVRVDPPAEGDMALDLDLAPIASAVFVGRRSTTLGEGQVSDTPFWTPGGMPHVERLRAFHEDSDGLSDDPFRRIGPITFGTVPLYYEGRIEPGAEVTVRGSVVERSVGADGERRAMTADADGSLVLSERPAGDRHAARSRSRRRRYYAGLFYVALGIVTVAAALIW